MILMMIPFKIISSWRVLHRTSPSSYEMISTPPINTFCPFPWLQILTMINTRANIFTDLQIILNQPEGHQPPLKTPDANPVTTLHIFLPTLLTPRWPHPTAAMFLCTRVYQGTPITATPTVIQRRPTISPTQDNQAILLPANTNHKESPSQPVLSITHRRHSPIPCYLHTYMYHFLPLGAARQIQLAMASIPTCLARQLRPTMETWLILYHLSSHVIIGISTFLGSSLR